MQTEQIPLSTRIATSLENGTSFLANQQQEPGAWEILVSDNPDFEGDLRPLIDVFTTAYILREIAGCQYDHAGLGTMKARASDYLASQRRKNGLWRFYKNGDLRLLPTDFDTSSMVAAALLLSNYDFDTAPILELLAQYQHPDGGYWVYTMPPKAPTENWFYPLEENYAYEHVMDTHILVFLAAAGADYQPHLEHLKSILNSRQYEKPQLFYDSPLLFLYNLAKVLDYQPDDAETLRQTISQHLTDHLGEAENNPIKLAMVVGTMARCRMDTTSDYALQLINAQQDDGGWENRYLHYNPIHYYGCRAVVTAFALHALEQVRLSL